MAEGIEFRVSRIYSAIDAVEETDLTRLKAYVLRNESFFAVSQDFRGGLSLEDIANYADSLVDNVAYFRDHLIKWAEQNDKPSKRIHETVNESSPLLIIRDLSNNNKHGYPPKDGKGYSGQAPRLINVDRILRLTTLPVAGSRIGFTLNADGSPRVFGDGSAMAVITGQVVDLHNDKIGDLHDLVVQAVEDWDKLLREFDIID